MNLSKNFTLNELVKSEVALRYGFDNSPTTSEIIRLKYLAENILQPIRDKFGAFTVNSAFRSKLVNDKVGSTDKSQHRIGEAADFEHPKLSNLELAKWIKSNLIFDQLLLEFYTEGDPYSGWVHCSYHNGPDRKQSLRVLKENGKIVYKEGLE